MTAETAEADIRSAYEWLSSNAQVRRTRFRAWDFAWEGGFHLLRTAWLRCARQFRFTEEESRRDYWIGTAKLQAPSLFIWGGLDKHITPEQRRAVTEALSAQKKTYVNVEFSRADHGFFCDERAAYEPQSARQAWALTLEFLRS